ncbi:MAG: O-antigen ligase family protein [Nitrospirae bacterium]|nr:O-antigen ligase family protein [Nitrospirota bacterium]
MTGISLAVIVISSALLFGAVENWSIAVIGILTAASFIFFIFSLKSDSEQLSGFKIIIAFVILLAVYPLLQLIPLPVSLISIFHPLFKDIINILPEVNQSYHSLSIYPFATEMELSRNIIYLMVFSMAALGLRDRNNMHNILKAIVIFGFILSIFGILQKAAWNGKIYWFRELTQGGVPFGPFVNRNHFAGFIGMILPLSLGIGFISRDPNKKVMYIFFSVVMGIALFFSLSRGGIVSFFASMIMFSFIVFAKTLSTRRLVPIVMFLVALFSYLIYLGVTPIIDRFSQTDIANEQRLLVWQGTYTAIKDYAFFGSGLGTYRYVFKIYQPDNIAGYYDHAHNDYLELLLEAGIVGAAIVFLFIAYILRMLLRVDLTTRRNYLTAGYISSLTAIAAHSIVDFNLHIPSNALLLSLILGISVFYAREASGDL